jgi:hypothetical protein
MIPARYGQQAAGDSSKARMGGEREGQRVALSTDPMRSKQAGSLTTE